jgi:hypothetical protein
MRGLKTIVAVLAVLALLALPVLAKIKIGVVEFEERNVIGLDGAAKVVPELLAENLVNVDVYEVTERLLVLKVLQEQALGQTGVVDEKTAPQVGKIYGVQGLVTGSFMKVGGEITINARLIDTETGRVMAASTVKFTDINNLNENLEIAAHELSGISRESLKIKKETTQKGKTRIGAALGGDLTNDYLQETGAGGMLGFFLNSRHVTFDFIGLLPLSNSTSGLALYPGVTIHRYVTLNLGYAMLNLDSEGYGKLNNSERLRVGEKRMKGELNYLLFGVTLTPSYRLHITLNMGGNLGSKVSVREHYTVNNPDEDTWSNYKDNVFAPEFPLPYVQFGVDYLLNDRWGVRGGLIKGSANGRLTGNDVPPAGVTLPDEQYHEGFFYYLAGTYSFAFGKK